MFIVPIENQMNNKQKSVWSHLQQAIRDLELKGINEGDRWAFHGTSQQGAAGIERDGFNLSWVSTMGLHGQKGPADCVYWGTADAAIQRSYHYAHEDRGFPVIIAARLSDILSSGTPFPDLCMWEISTDCGEDGTPMPTTWDQSLNSLSAFTVIDGKYVQNLEFFRIQPDHHRPIYDPKVAEAIWSRSPVPEPWGGEDKYRLADDLQMADVEISQAEVSLSP